MIAIARGKYLRVSSMKMRQVIDAIRGKDVLTSVALLAQINKGCKRFGQKSVGFRGEQCQAKRFKRRAVIYQNDHRESWRCLEAFSCGIIWQGHPDFTSDNAFNRRIRY